MLIETSNAIYETFFQHAQIEITGRCNMRCQHCRAWDEAKIDMSMDTIQTILKFAKTNSESNFRLTISGGEPFLHPHIIKIVRTAKKLGIEDVIITTNGSLVTKQNICDLEAINLRNLCIQISIDSIYKEKHDFFRSHKNAFKEAVQCLKDVGKSKLTASLRATITPTTIIEIEKLILMAKDCNATRVGIGSVIPAGRGSHNKELLMTPIQKKNFLERLSNCKKKYPKFDITTEDPLKFNTSEQVWDYGGFDCSDPAFFGGCTAGITGFNVDSEGTITPCAVLLKPITNVVGKTQQEILSDYTSSDVIHNLITKNFSGKCGECELKRLCGGCRAVAEGSTGDYLSSDTSCWK